MVRKVLTLLYDSLNLINQKLNIPIMFLKTNKNIQYSKKPGICIYTISSVIPTTLLQWVNSPTKCENPGIVTGKQT